MGSEFEVRIEGYSQYTESPFQGQYGVVHSDMRMGVRLCKLGVNKIMVDFVAEIAKHR